MAFTHDPSCENTLAREDHVPSTDEHSGCSKRRLDHRTTVSKVGGRVSTRGWRNTTDLTSMIVEKLKHGQNLLAGDASGKLFPFGTSLECFPYNKGK